MGLNHIYKVIWSKTKNAWVVVSEIAKRDGKSSVKSVVTSLAGKSVAAVMVAMVMCGGVASADTQYGTGATASQGRATAIGENADANKTGATAIGYGAKSLAEEAIAIGDYATANSGSAISIGTANATGLKSIAIGTSTMTKDESSVAIGNSAVVMKSHGIAIGTSTQAQDFGSVVIGRAAYAKGIAIGDGSFDTGGGVALGHGAKSQGSGIGIGWGAQSTSGISLGNYATGSDGSVSIGIGSNAYDHSIAIGESATVNGSYSISMGLRNIVKSDKSGAIGYQSHMDNDAIETYVLGNTNGDASNLIKAKNSGIFGNSNQTGQSTITGIRVIGNNNTVKSSNVMVMGNNVTVDTGYDGAVVLGHQSATQAYTNPTDTTVSGLTLSASRYAGKGGSLAQGSILSIGDTNKERQIKNVAAGVISATSTDAVNGSQLYEAVRAVSAGASPDVYMHVNDGTSTQGAGNATTNLGKANEKGGATGNSSIAIGKSATAQGITSIAIGMNASTDATHGLNGISVGNNAKALESNTIALGTDAESNSSSSIAIGRNSKAKASTSISIGDSSVANGLKSTILGSSNSIDDNSGDSVILGTDSSVVGSLSKPSGSSVLLGVLNHITNSPTAVGIGNNVNISESDNGIGIGSFAQISNSIESVALGKLAKATNAAAGIAIGSNSEVADFAGISIGFSTKALGKQSIAIGLGNEVKGDKSSAIGDPSYIDTVATGTHVQGNDNGTATNPIKAAESTFMGNTNLAGTAGTTGIHVVGNNNTVDSSNVMVMGNNVTVGTGLDGAVVLGHASTADQYAAATDSTINGVTFEAAGYAGNTGLNKGSIVSVGATGAERQIKNVAAGAVTATSTDAINGSQLYKTAETILKMPINMAGDSGDTVGLKLGKTVNIKGSVASGADVTDGNIAVVGDKATSTLSLKMAKNLTGLTSGTSQMLLVTKPLSTVLA